MKMPSNVTHTFAQVPQANIPRSVFDRSHCYKTTFDAGYLIPFLVDEALPGDTFNVDATIFTRLTTPIVPFMDNLYLDTFYFAVPLRLVWDNFQHFMGEKDDPDDDTEYSIPQLVAGGSGFASGSLADYFGLPTGVPGLSVSSLFHRAYNLIYNEWFRDQNIIEKAVVDKDNGTDTESDYVLRRRGKRHDYFTSCLPWPQKGDTVELPLGTEAPVLGLGKYNTNWDTATSVYETGTYTGTVSFAHSKVITAVNPDQYFYAEMDETHTGYPNIRADLSAATASTINALREAFQLQRLLERDARGGTRYREIIKAHFGVESPDARLQRPEFLGGNSTPIMVTPIAQTNATGATGTPQGNLAAFATGASRGEGFVKSFTEHCIVMGILSVRADLTYQNGIPKMFSRLTKYDFYWPALANLGEQAVLNKEIYAQGTGHEAADAAAFGYQERWAEYRYYPSKITGLLRSIAAGSLDVWHLSQEFTALPVLTSKAFIEENPPISRVVAVASQPNFVMDSFIKSRCVRPMPTYSVPGLIDHF